MKASGTIFQDRALDEKLYNRDKMDGDEMFGSVMTYFCHWLSDTPQHRIIYSSILVCTYKDPHSTQLTVFSGEICKQLVHVFAQIIVQQLISLPGLKQNN